MPTQTAEKRHVVTIIAPPGSLGVTLIEDKGPQSDGCCMVDSVKDTSSLFGRIRKGDKLASIDDCSIRTWNLTELVGLINQKAHLPERKIIVLRMSPEESSTSSTQTTTQSSSTEDDAAAQDRARIVAAARAAAGYTGNNANALKESIAKKISAHAFSRNVAAWNEHQRLLAKQKQNKAAMKEVAKEKKAALKASQKKAQKKQPKVAKAKPAMQKKKPFAEKPPAAKPPAEKPKEYDPMHPVALRDLKPVATHSVSNRPDVRNELMRAFELHQGANTFEKMMQDESVANNPEASAKLKILIDKMRLENKIILDTPDSTLTIFERNLKGLILFHQEHGHCSPSEKEDKGLYRFVSYQRGRYKRRDEFNNRMGCIGEDIALLNRLGFEWLGVKAQGRSWEENVELLMAFKAEKGHTRVPQLYEMDGVKLGYWVSLQRKEYEKRSEGVSAYITEERIDTLESIGFQWKLRFGRPKKDDPQYRNRRYGPFPNDAGELTTPLTTPIAPSNESSQGSEDGKLEAMDTVEASNKSVANSSPVLSPTRNLRLDEESEKALDTILNGSGRGSRELKSLLANDGSGGRIKRH
eukprot:CAMPEP_0198286788 /NCGR_PEP_ID=MMETSP1449-20131203/5759_1 /TAXON_ID=420275 /ORGANISM="Attheya septentrionalis, Strain CCMP2084" /LENGTH=581 /DNA_ID=CAMNT_0043984589 /DNA_START=59 /DNA_END=1804 /DNA_ORIENTATION=+